MTCNLSEFSTCLLHLKQLQFLEVSSNVLDALQSPDSILQVSEFNALEHLGLCNSHSSVPMHWGDQAHDLHVKLEDMLRPRGPGILQY